MDGYTLGIFRLQEKLFEGRKQGPRKCPDCAQPMIDMGPYFEPPRKAAVKRWQVMKVLADNDLRFNSKDANAYIDNRILVVKNPRNVDVIERIDDERRRNESTE